MTYNKAGVSVNQWKEKISNPIHNQTITQMYTGFLSFIILLLDYWIIKNYVLASLNQHKCAFLMYMLKFFQTWKMSKYLKCICIAPSSTHWRMEWEILNWGIVQLMAGKYQAEGVGIIYSSLAYLNCWKYLFFISWAN